MPESTQNIGDQFGSFGALEWGLLGAGTALTVSGSVLSEREETNWPSRGDTFLKGKIVSEETWRDYSDGYGEFMLPGAALSGSLAQDIQAQSIYRTTGLASTILLSTGLVNTMKKTIGRERPDLSDNESFPSGHTNLAMATSTYNSLDLAYSFGDDAPAITYSLIGAQMTAAGLVGVARNGGNKHYWEDIVVGGSIGVASAAINHQVFVKDHIPREAAGTAEDLPPALVAWAVGNILGATAFVEIDSLKKNHKGSKPGVQAALLPGAGTAQVGTTLLIAL